MKIQCRNCGATPEESEDIYEYSHDTERYFCHRHLYQCCEYLKKKLERLQEADSVKDAYIKVLENEPVRSMSVVRRLRVQTRMDDLPQPPESEG